MQRQGQCANAYTRKSSKDPSACCFGRVQSSALSNLAWCTVTCEYSQKNDGHPPPTVHVRANHRFHSGEVKMRRCVWLWKFTPTSIPEIQPSIVAAAATKAILDQGPVMPASLACWYSKKAHAYASRQARWKTTQCRSWGWANSPRRRNASLVLPASLTKTSSRQSIATQREFAERYCALHQLHVGAVFADDGVSGTVPLHLRPAAARILPDARLHRFDQLLVYRLDRLGRDTRLTLQAVAELEQCGVRVKSLTEDFDTATASGRLMLTLLSGFAAHEREVIRERSLAGSQRVAQNGGWLGGRLPFGYCRAGGQRQAGMILSEEPLPGLDVSAAEVIRRIFRMAAEDRQSCPRIADYLNALGVPRTSDGVAPHPASPSESFARWRAGRVRNLLISTVYKGQHVYGKRGRNQKRAPIVRSVPAIVSEAVWQQAQATLQHNYRFGPRHCRHAYLLRGLVRCGLCGLTYIGMTVHSRSGRQESYYRCNGKHDTYGVYGAMGQR